MLTEGCLVGSWGGRTAEKGGKVWLGRIMEELNFKCKKVAGSMNLSQRTNLEIRNLLNLLTVRCACYECHDYCTVVSLD